MENITIYRRTADGKIALVGTADKLSDLFLHFRYGKVKTEEIKKFGYTFNDRFSGTLFSWDTHRLKIKAPDREIYLDELFNNRHYCYLVFDNKDRLIAPDRIMGSYRAYRRQQNYEYWFKWGRFHRGTGTKHSRYSCRLRAPKTTQERRWYHAWDDEEYVPKCRASRSLKHLPTAWDDIYRKDSNNKNWKRHRKHQYKE